MDGIYEVIKHPKKMKLYLENSESYQEAEQIKSLFNELKKVREPLYLKATEFDRILRWKLKGQYGRQQEWRLHNNEDTLKKITSLAFNIQHINKEYELELRFGILSSLRGVGIPVASAFLALCYPEQYAVIDHRGWRQVFGVEKTSFTISNYKLYLENIKLFADMLGWTPQEVDLAIWEYDKQH